MADTKLRVPKATSLLKDDHKKVKKLFAEYDKLEDDDQEGCDRIFEEIKTELTIHAQIEEEIFYPATAAAQDEEARMLVSEAREEHKIVKQLLDEIESLDEGDEDECEAKMKVLKESVLHHAEEEEKELFPVFDELEREQRDQVAELLVARKRELQGGEQ